jgi:Uma2 family endonuclease
VAEESMVDTTAQVRRFTRKEYERMAAQGILRPDERVELLDGEIVVMSPQGSRHTTVLRLVEKALNKAFGAGYDVRTQVPLLLGARSEPEPDVAVVTGSPDDYLDEHPKTALLVVEVADRTLALDRGKKLAIYARAGIQDCWIINLVDRVLEVHRNPRPSSGKLGWTFKDVQRLKNRETVRPLAAPRAKLSVASFLR